MAKIIQVRCGSCGQVLSVEIPSTQQPKPFKGPSVGYSNLERQNQSDAEFRNDIEQWLKTPPNYASPSMGFSNLAAMKNEVLTPEVARQKRMGFV